MAKLKISGLTELQKQIAEIAEMDGGKIANEMLKAGSKEVADTWTNVSRQKHVLTGEMVKNIKSSRIKKNKYGRFTVTYPFGSETRVRRGQIVKVRHAEKAFYQHYGYFNVLAGRYIPGDRFVDTIDAEAEPKANKTMQQIWDNYLKKKGK